MGNRIEEKREINTGNYGSRTRKVKPQKTLADVLKSGKREANAARRSAAETQEFLKWALQNCKNQGDLDAIREMVNTHGTPKQRKAFAKLEYDLTHLTGKKKAAIGNIVSSLESNAEAREAAAAEPVLSDKQKRRAEIAKLRQEKLARKENFRQAMLNAESVEDLKALEKEYGTKFTGNLKSTYNARLHALEKAAGQAAAQHTEMQGVYNGLFGYGNGKHPSVTELGTAKPTATSGMTWAKYTGGKYSGSGLSGVVTADRLAEEAIARNKTHAEMQNFYEELFKDYEYKPPVSESPVATPSAFDGNVEKPPVNTPPTGGNTPSVGGNKPPVSGNKPPVGGNRKPPVQNGGNGFKMPKIGKKGKFAIATLVIGAIGGAIAYFANKSEKKMVTPEGRELKPGIIPTPIDTIKRDTTYVAPVTLTQKKREITVPPEKIDEIEQKVVSEIPYDNETGKYVVRKDDNCWNIAKAELIKEKGGEMPSDKEVLERTLKIIEQNTLHFEADKYTVLIYPNDTLNIKM